MEIILEILHVQVGNFMLTLCNL